MNSAALMALSWWLHTLLGGGLLLFLAWLLLGRIRQPARRQRLAEWTMAAALLLPVLSLGPAWLIIPLPVQAPPTPVAASPEPPTLNAPVPAPAPAAEPGPEEPGLPADLAGLLV